MPKEPRSSNPWVRLLVGMAASAVLLAPAIRSADAEEAGPGTGGKARKELTPATAPSEKATPRAVVRVISIPLQECPADDNEAMNAVKAFIDPATGQLRAPTPEDEVALARAIAPKAALRARAEREVMVTARGIQYYEVGEEGMQDVVVRTGSDGKPVFLCTPRSETPKALTHPLAPKKSEPANEEK